MRSLLMITLFVCAVPDRPNPTPDENKTLAEKIQGDWESVNLIMHGVLQQPTQRDGEFTTIDAGRWIGIKHGKPKDGNPTTYTVNATKIPATIDFVIRPGATEIQLFGIIKIEGDLLTVCYSMDRASRPTEFVSTPNSQALVLEMKRCRK